MEKTQRTIECSHKGFCYLDTNSIQMQFIIMPPLAALAEFKYT